jgi:hypothetical protein
MPWKDDVEAVLEIAHAYWQSRQYFDAGIEFLLAAELARVRQMTDMETNCLEGVCDCMQADPTHRLERRLLANTRYA